ncbi:hypothetical protein [Hydrogenophaga sp.]|uniref:hypothetical protein n=1 Tax=Hydrogenophaga sp. TaxID=1904254 RepID=UPI003F6BB814
MRPDAARVAAVIRIDAAWLATAPLDMRAGTDTALARVIATHEPSWVTGAAA